MVAAKPRARTLDFTDVKERSEWNPRLVEEGDYEGKILSVVEQVSKKKEDGSGGEDMWVFGFGINDMPSARYPYYCLLNADNLWKIRNIATACGIQVGGKKAKIDPSRFVGKGVALSMETEIGTGTYKDKSIVRDVFKLSDLLGDTDDDPEQPDDEDDEDEEPEPPKRTTRARRKPAPVVEDDDDEDDEPEPPKRRGRPRKPAPVIEPEDDDDDEDEEEEEPVKKPAARRSRRAPAPVEDDEDDEDEEPPTRRRRAATKKPAASTTRRRKPPVDDDDMEIEDL